MHKNVVIVNGDHDFGALKNLFENVDYVSSDYITYELLESLGVEYLYKEGSYSEKHVSSVYSSALNWYKDSEGNDVVNLNGVSFGPVIARSVMASFSNDYRNYLAFKTLLEKYSTIYLNSRSASSFHRTASVFGDRICWYDFDENIDINRTSSPVRTVINQYPYIHPFSKYIRFLQQPFLMFFRKKTLIWPDWTYNSIFIKKNDCLLLNSTRPWRGCYLSEGKYFNFEAEKVFPISIKPNYINLNRIRRRLTELHINWEEGLTKLFIATIARVYSDSYLELRRAYIIYKDLLCHYKPKSIVFPGCTHFAYLIAIQIARKQNIKTTLIADGYPIVKDESNYFYFAYKGDYVFDKYVAFGKVNKELLVKYNRIPESRIILAQSPLVKKVNNHPYKGERHGVMVMAYYPNQHNTNTRWDKRVKTVVDIVRCVLNSGETNVLIKIKDGSASSLELKFYMECFSRYGLSNRVEVVTGELNQYVFSVKYIVGQISTALFESICADTPYYIYEPYDCGVLDADIETSALIKPEDVFRDLKNLEEAINKNFGYYNVVDKEIIIGGKDLSSVCL